VSYSKSAKTSMHLVHTTPGDLVQLGALDEPLLSGAGVRLDLREGEVVQCLRNDSHGVLVARRDGTRILVPVMSAQEVGVRWFPDLHDSGDASAGQGPRMERTR